MKPVTKSILGCAAIICALCAVLMVILVLVFGGYTFVYSSDGESYTLYKKLNWDGGIDFSSSRPEWCYGENDEPSFPIDR